MRQCVRCGALHYEDATECREDGHELVERPDPRLGVVLGGRYTLVSPLGAGGMATVYRGAHVRDGRSVAVKLLHPHLAVDKTQRERFRREIRAAAALAHPHIITVYDCGEAPDGCPYLVMELLQGKPLSALLKDGPLPFSTGVLLGAQIAEAVARAHDLGVVHRDLKPANVFVQQDARGLPFAKLVDFGLSHTRQDARLTMSGMLLGSPPYIAPEAIVRQDAGPSVDLYALGCVLFELVVGQPPFVRPNIPAMITAHLLEAPPAPSSKVQGIPTSFDLLVLSLLAKNPPERPADAHRVARALQAMLPPGFVPPPIPGLESNPIATSPSSPPSGTVLLERWRWIGDGLGKVLDTAFPNTSLSSSCTAQFNRFRAALTALETNNAEVETARERADALEEEASESRARFGHAVEALGHELSTTREQQAELMVGLQDARVAFARVGASCNDEEERLAQQFRAGIPAPSEALAKALRSAAEAVEAWLQIQARVQTWERSQVELEARVRDLEFQVRALRERLSYTEEGFNNKRVMLDALFARCAQRRGDALQELRQSANLLIEEVRANPSVQEQLHTVEASLQDPGQPTL